MMCAALQIGRLGQCPVHRYNELLMNLVLSNRLPKLKDALNIKVVSMEEAVTAYESFNKVR
jgi:glutathione-independent formaldehyde dehydrogenase